MKFRDVEASMRNELATKRSHVAECFDRRMAAMSSGSAVWFVALNDSSEVLGWVILNWASAHREASVEDLWVDPSHRRTGVATALMIELMERAQTRGEPTLFLAVNPTESRPAARLYERLGFTYDDSTTYLDGVYDGHEDWVVDMHKSF